MPKLVANGKPGLITSLGLLVSIGMAAFAFAARDGEQREAQRRTDAAVQRLADEREALRKEWKDDLRHEVLVGCHCIAGSRP